MKGDFTRFTFDPKKHYNRVLMQQGRVQLDADWNEEAHIQAHLRQTEAKDVIGHCGAPTTHDGFKIDFRDDQGSPDLMIFPGRIYVDGILCELEATPIDVSFTEVDNETEVPTLTVDGRTFEVGDWVEIFVEDGTVDSQLIRIEEIKTEDIDPNNLIFTLKFTGDINQNLREATDPKPKLRRITTYKTQADYPLYPEEFVEISFLNDDKNKAEVSVLVLDGRALEVWDWVVIFVEDGTANSQLLQIEEIDPENMILTFNVPVNDDLLTATEPKLHRELPVHVPSLVYLDVWERHITAIDDPDIREVALGGPDTATRTKTVGQVKLLPLSFDPLEESDPIGVFSCSQEFSEWNDLIEERNARLAAQTNNSTESSTESSNPCDVLPGSRYLGLGNQLYRVEIHDGNKAISVNPVSGTSNQVEVKENDWLVDGRPWRVGQLVEVEGQTKIITRINSVNFDDRTLTLMENIPDVAEDTDLVLRGVATFKWSRDNGSVVRAIKKIENNNISFENPGQDVLEVFAQGQWVEITDEWHDLRELPGVLVQVISVDGFTLTFDPAKVEGDVELTEENFPPERKPKVRRWDHKTEQASVPISSTEWIDLENEIQVAFHEGDEYKTGDFWLIHARAATGKIEWPLKNGQEPEYLQRFGIEHHYCRLAILAPSYAVDEMPVDDEVPVRDEADAWEIKDCRKLFPPLTGLTRFFYVGGGGQEAMPNEELDHPLQVGVSNWRWPVANVPVKFEVIEGGGTLMTSVDTFTGPDGVAECRWTLGDSDSGPQRVMATMRDENDEPIGVPIFFDADLSVASQVAYDEPRCSNLVNADTVHNAIDELCNNNALYYVGGDGQEGMPGQQLASHLLVGVSNGRWLVANAPVKFEVIEGDGTLAADTETGTDGVAECLWTLGDSGPQRVKVTLVDGSGGQLGLPIFFNANVSLASQVAYDPKDCPSLTNVNTVQGAIDILCHPKASQVAYDPNDCPSLAGVDTVQEAIDGLCRQILVSYVGGDGQEAMPGYELPGPLQVRVTRGSYPLSDALVLFKIVDGKGSLRETSGVNSDDELEVPTDENGVAGCFCMLDENVTVKALLKKPKQLDQSPIRFNANVSLAEEVAYLPPRECPQLLGVETVKGAIDVLCKMDGSEPGIHIENVLLRGADRLLRNGDKLFVEEFADGLLVVCDNAPHPETLKEKPTCFVTLDLPFPLNDADRKIWGNGLLGFQPLILASNVSVKDNIIFWEPIENRKDWLKNGGLFYWIMELGLGNSMLAHLTLKGNFIWSKDNPNLYLDGEAFGAPPGERLEHNLRLPSGDGRRGGDFEMWFWLTQE